MIVKNYLREYIEDFFHDHSVIWYFLFGKNRDDISKLNERELKEHIRKIERCFFYRSYFIVQNVYRDIVLYLHEGRNRYSIDNSKSENDYISLACIAKNEGEYILEYLDFYFSLGVDRVYFYDNESTDNTKELIDHYIKSGKVVYSYFPGKNVQFSAYRNAIKRCKKHTRWLMLLDADEFLFPVKEMSLKKTLEEYEEYPAIGVNWVLFGPCGHEKKPFGGVVENYTKTFINKDHVYNCRIKSIVNPKEVESITSPHYCLYKKGRFAVDEQKNEIDGSNAYVKGCGLAFTQINNREKLRINHYITKSKEELRRKCERGYPDGTMNPDYKKSLDRFNEPLKDDFILLDYIKKLN